MSVSRMTGKTYYTDEEKERALQNNNALQYALSRGYHLVKCGSEYHLKEHDSMVFKLDGRWYWNSQGLHGRALDFIQGYENRTYQEAVCILAGTIDRPAPVGPVMTAKLPPADEKREFILPEKADSFKNIFAYLIKERGVDGDLVRRLVRENKIYQSRNHNNLVMVGYDSEGKARYASLRSTNSYTKAFKIDAAGSDKSYPFVIEGNSGTHTVCVFESPIEAMSYWTLCKITGSSRIDSHMISLGGAAARQALDRFLREHKQISSIVLGLNNDKKEFGHKIDAGRNGIKKLLKAYGKDYHITVHQPYMDDWNDVLKNYRRNLEGKLPKIREPERPRVNSRAKQLEMAI